MRISSEMWWINIACIIIPFLMYLYMVSSLTMRVFNIYRYRHIGGKTLYFCTMCWGHVTRPHLGRTCLPDESTGRASLKKSGGSLGICPVRTVMLTGDGEAEMSLWVLCTARDGSVLLCLMDDGSSRYSSTVKSSTRPSTTARLRRKLIVSLGRPACMPEKGFTFHLSSQDP